MCARYELDAPYQSIANKFNTSLSPQLVPKVYPDNEVRPTDSVPIIIDYKLILKRWGLTLEWSDKPIINARSETISLKKTFQRISENRCLIPATAYFEWRRAGKQKQKIRIKSDHSDIMALAGLFSDEQFIILTCPPIHSISQIHDRMPVVLSKKAATDWMSNKPLSSFGEAVTTDEKQTFSFSAIDLLKPKELIQRDLFE